MARLREYFVVRLIEDFSDDLWNKFHPNSIPISHTLKYSEQKNWVRLHTLPQAKRYSETEAEKETICFRQNSIAEFILGGGSKCRNYYCELEGAEANPNLQQILSRDFDKFRNSTKSEYFSEDYEGNCVIHCFDSIWQTNSFNRVLFALANDELKSVIWMSAQTGAIFAPYDGGIDLILPSIEQCNKAREKFKDWISSHPAGF